jgi:hypothetical protein
MNRWAAMLLATLPLAACATTSEVPPAAAICPPSDNWQVWYDIPRRGHDLALFVDGEVDVPRGMVARIRPGPLDKSLPPAQRIVLELRPGKGPAGKQRVRGFVRAALEYREVIITCGDEVLDRIAGDTIETAD